MPAPTPPTAIDAVPPTPDRNEGEVVFVPKMYNFLDYFAPFKAYLQLVVTYCADAITWVASLAAAAEASATAAAGSVDDAAAQATLATAEKVAAQAAAAASEQAAGLTPDPDFGMVISTQSILNLKTAPFTAVVGETYRIDTSAGGFDFYPPAGMTQGQVFHIIDHAGTFNINSPRLVAGSYKIMGETIDLILTQKNQRRTFEYAGATKGLEF